MVIYGELKACCLDIEGWAWIKQFDPKKYRMLEMFSTTIHEAYKSLNENGETHYEGQMVRKILEKMNVPNNA